MSDSKWTHGEWIYNRGAGTISAIVGSERRVICRYIDPDNANLVVASKALYAALEACLDWFDGSDLEHPVVDNARAALLLARPEGGQK